MSNDITTVTTKSKFRNSLKNSTITFVDSENCLKHHFFDAECIEKKQEGVQFDFYY